MKFVVRATLIGLVAHSERSVEFSKDVVEKVPDLRDRDVCTGDTG